MRSSQHLHHLILRFKYLDNCIEDEFVLLHEVLFEGQCRVVYRPEGSKKCKGAKVWIEVPPTSKVMITNWNGAEGEKIRIFVKKVLTSVGDFSVKFSHLSSGCFTSFTSLFISKQ